MLSTRGYRYFDVSLCLLLRKNPVVWEIYLHIMRGLSPIYRMRVLVPDCLWGEILFHCTQIKRDGGYKAASEFCRENYLSMQTMETVEGQVPSVGRLYIYFEHAFTS